MKDLDHHSVHPLVYCRECLLSPFSNQQLAPSPATLRCSFLYISSCMYVFVYSFFCMGWITYVMSKWGYLVTSNIRFHFSLT